MAHKIILYYIMQIPDTYINWFTQGSKWPSGIKMTSLVFNILWHIRILFRLCSVHRTLQNSNNKWLLYNHVSAYPLKFNSMYTVLITAWIRFHWPLHTYMELILAFCQQSINELPRWNYVGLMMMMMTRCIKVNLYKQFNEIIEHQMLRLEATFRNRLYIRRFVFIIRARWTNQKHHVATVTESGYKISMNTVIL